MKEEWKDVPGFEGYYKASNSGDIMNNNSTLLKQVLNKKTGYLSVQFYKNGVRTRLTSHTVIAMSFLTKGDNQCVNHKDCNKLNNNVANLEWTTFKGNVSHSFDNGRNGSMNGKYGANHNRSKGYKTVDQRIEEARQQEREKAIQEVLKLPKKRIAENNWDGVKFKPTNEEYILVKDLEKLLTP